jgi:hypothetical protein
MQIVAAVKIEQQVKINFFKNLLLIKLKSAKLTNFI